MDPQELAKQLRRPEGENGITVGNNMNQGNRSMYELVFSMMEVRGKDKVLEIGFGNGKFIPELVGKAKNVFYAGIDFSDAMLKEAKRNNQQLIQEDKIEIQNASISSIPYQADFFDKVFTINTLYFWENPEKDIQEVYRVLKKGGEFYLGIRPKQSVMHLPFTKFGFRLYEPDEAKQLMISAGFKNISSDIQEDPPVNFQGIEVRFQGMCLKGIK